MHSPLVRIDGQHHVRKPIRTDNRVQLNVINAMWCRDINNWRVSTGTFRCSVLNVFRFLCHAAMERNVLVRKSSGPVWKKQLSSRQLERSFYACTLLSVWDCQRVRVAGEWEKTTSSSTNKGRNSRILQKFTESLRFSPTRALSFFVSSFIDLPTHVSPTPSIRDTFFLIRGQH